jgi:hypothetical protein
MAKTKVGERYSVSLGIPIARDGGKEDVAVFNDAAVTQFSLEIPVNMLPFGTAKVVGESDDTKNPISGVYGSLIFQGVKTDGSALEIPIYITSAVNTELSENASSIDLEFTVGSEGMHSIMDALAVDGTSVEAMSKIFTSLGANYVDYVTPVKGANGVSDNMTWRFVSGTMSDYLDNVVRHSSLNGDILYWSFDDANLNFRIGSFNVSKASKNKNFMMYTHDSITTTASAKKRVKGCDTDVWYYSGYLPSDLSGDLRVYRAPNMIIDSSASGSNKDTGICSKDCWTAIIGAMGANEEYLENSAYGKQYVVKPFPGNTHKTYSIAPFVRNYMLAEYSRMVKVRIYNHPGPAIGSCVHFYAASAKLKSGDFLPDDNYTARYIVVGKKIVKDATTSVGVLGVTTDTNTSDMVTELTMVTNNGYAGTLSPDYKAVMQLAESVTTAIEKERK